MGEIDQIQEEFKALINSLSLMNQEVLNLTERQDVMNQDVKELGLKVGNMQHIFDAAMDKIQGLPQLQQPEQGRFENSMMSSKSTTTTSILISANSISDLPENATSTGSNSTILPSITSASRDISFTLPNNIFYNAINDNLEYFIYEEEVFASNFNDERFLSAEDQDFVDSIRSTTFSGIYLSSACNYSSFTVTTLTGLDDSDIISKELIIVTKRFFSCISFLGVIITIMRHKYYFNRRFTIYITNQFIIFIWDPGIY